MAISKENQDFELDSGRITVTCTGSWGHNSTPWKSLRRTKVFAHFPHTVGYKTSGVISGRQLSYSATMA